MVMGRTRVLRGQISGYSIGGAVNLIQDDSRFNHGFIIKRFVMSYGSMHSSSAGSRDFYAALTTNPDSLPTSGTTAVRWNWADRRQLAWYSWNSLGDSYGESVFELVDPTHVVVRDLWIAVTSAVETSADAFNYYIELEQVELSDNQAVLAIVQEEAQDVN